MVLLHPLKEAALLSNNPIKLNLHRRRRGTVKNTDNTDTQSLRSSNTVDLADVEMKEQLDNIKNEIDLIKKLCAQK